MSHKNDVCFILPGFESNCFYGLSGFSFWNVNDVGRMFFRIVPQPWNVCIFGIFFQRIFWFWFRFPVVQALLDVFMIHVFCSSANIYPLKIICLLLSSFISEFIDQCCSRPPCIGCHRWWKGYRWLRVVRSAYTCALFHCLSSKMMVNDVMCRLVDKSFMVPRGEMCFAHRWQNVICLLLFSFNSEFKDQCCSRFNSEPFIEICSSRCW